MGFPAWQSSDSDNFNKEHPAEKMGSDFAVIICTYNGADRLPEVLDRLRSQTGTESLRWEVLVVDNNSRDRTAEVVQQYQKTWQHPFPLRYCLELQQGAGFARKRGIRETRSELVGFLDDDNLPELDWVAKAFAFAQANPQAGAYGSQIHGQFENEPAPELRPLLPFLAIVERGSKPLRYDSLKRVLPPSAGLVVRRQAWMGSVPDRCLLEGRTHQSMLTGEDTEVLARIQRNGWEIWYNPSMELHHKIPSWRLERDYLIPFFKGIGLSRYVTRMLGVQPWLRPLAIVGYMANDLRKIVCHYLRYGPGLQSNLVAECEMTLFVSSLISPWFILGRQWQDMMQQWQETTRKLPES